MSPIDRSQQPILSAALTATVGHAVTLTLTVTNASSLPHELHFSSAQQADFHASQSGDSAASWHWADGMSFGQMLTSVSLLPGETLVRTVTLQAPAGTWLVTGELTSTSHRAEATTIVTVS